MWKPKIFLVGFNDYPHKPRADFSAILDQTMNLPSGSLKLILESNNQFDVQTPLLLKGIEWVFSWTEYSLSYSATIVYEALKNSFDCEDLDHLLLSVDSKLPIYLTLCVLQDLYSIFTIIIFPYISPWYNYIETTATNIIFYLEHPEYKTIHNSILVEHILPYISKIRFLIEMDTEREGIILIPFFVLDIVGRLGLFGIFVLFIMNWYHNHSMNNSMDSDFLVNSLTIEAEEEIASIDDTNVLLLVIFFIFGWFFFFNYVSLATAIGEVMLIFLFLPILMYILLLIPIYLLFDYGWHFVLYLRGAGSTSAILMEFIYDCIAFLAFFIRLGVQNVRLLLITLTFFSLYEFILFFANVSWFNSNFENLNSLMTHSQGAHYSYYYFLFFLSKLLYWVYELLHTFFVTVAQFVAFFAMVFWLFLFLYTMFVIEEFEKYFDQKRKNLQDRRNKNN
jgi:hypothetical protein